MSETLQVLMPQQCATTSQGSTLEQFRAFRQPGFRACQLDVRRSHASKPKTKTTQRALLLALASAC
ncbi:hypothetical protein COCC4DRAFT_34781 [Bipolaris maydis ATCC 48331]|uniref:Uncharacterized protein n=2 Tax=Cochliobolus heterostrophus TaxID=5016 RepID=M2UCJ6_COCH5|nr:uncharacterized protein COCC4DRAFT_34781 [Bipolaris maydis ATCC 48331]EMD85723.1 hypothetical protein COCHEDRAFT_1024336 [Bipolaris maydis C5]ENH99592.1 hypothetical protein COCC4DRAFT_34781 [Bipolaris maydis ATCC 48331]